MSKSILLVMNEFLQHLPFLEHMLPNERKRFEDALLTDTHLQKTFYNWLKIEEGLHKKSELLLENKDLLTLYAVAQVSPEVLSKEEQEALHLGKSHIQEALKHYPALQLVVNRLKEDALAFNQMWKEASKPKAQVFYLYRWMSAAALLLITLGGVWWLLNPFAESPPVPMAVETTALQQLPDGSTVKLDKDAKMELLFNEKVRQVRLKGNAYFEVKHLANNAKFQVVSQNAITQVLGTKFTVQSNSMQTTVHLIEGKVAFAAKENPQAQTILTPGETVSVIGSRLIENQRNIPTDLKWAGIWLFSDETFLSIAQKLTQEHKIDIQIDAKLQQERLNGRFSTTQNAEEILSALALSLNATVHKTPNGFIVNKE